MKIQLLFAWYDFWIGAFYDKKKNWLYILPFPMIGIIIKFPEKKIICDCQNYETGHISESCPIHN